MPRVTHVKKARKDYPDHGIKKGESYYFWKFRFGGKRYSKTYPKPSQLTQSEFLSTIYDINDELSTASFSTVDELTEFVEDVKTRIEELRDEQEEKRSNMPDHLQDVGSGELLQERYDYLDEMYSELDGISIDDYDEPDEDELKEEVLDDLFPNRRPEDEDEVDEEEEYEEVDDEAVTEEVERRKESHMQEWVDDKVSEISNISYQGN